MSPCLIRGAAPALLALCLATGGTAAAAERCEDPNDPCRSCCDLGRLDENPGTVPDGLAIVNCIDNTTFGTIPPAQRAQAINQSELAAKWDEETSEVMTTKLQGFSELYFGDLALPLVSLPLLTHARLLCKAIWISVPDTRTALQALQQ